MAEMKPKLLIVEDDEGLQAQLKWAYDDFDVVIAGDRASAIAALRAEEPPVVTLDLGLPPDPDGTSEGCHRLVDRDQNRSRRVRSLPQRVSPHPPAGDNPSYIQG